MQQHGPYGHEVRIRIGGPAGFGIKAAGASLARVFSAAGFYTVDLTEYPSLIKGGHNTYHLRISADPIHSHVCATDVLVALDATTVGLHADELTPGGAVIYDPDDGEPDARILEGREDLCLVPVPLTSIVREAGGVKIMRNVAALGAVLGHMDTALEPLTRSIRAQFAHKPADVADLNVAVAGAGYRHAKDAHCAFPYTLPKRGPLADSILTDGNEAIGLGALAAGVGLYCAYPMTPASSLLHFFARHGDSLGVAVKHTEDEIAAMNMVIGGAFGGTRSMCATSGGGFSLMVEALGFAGVSESACVVGLFTRPGPATGLPTWTEQSDLRFALHAAQGEFPRVVLAPGDNTQAFELTWQAFNLADELQTPVILLGDSYLSDNSRTTAPFDTDAVTVSRGKLIATGTVEGRAEALTNGRYARYKDADDGVSVRVLPGVDGAIHLVNSYEHDQYGFGAAGESSEVRATQNAKRLRKLDLARTLVPAPKRYGAAYPEVSIVCFGTTIMPVLEAMRWLAADGHDIAMLQPLCLWPFPAEATTDFLDQARLSLVIEGNATGQLEGLIAEQCLRTFDASLRRFDGRPISPEQVYAHVSGLLGKRVGLTAAGAITTIEEVQ